MRSTSICIHIVLLIACALGASSQVIDKGDGGQNPGSLWSDRYINPLTDKVAHREGDILTILISETSVATYGANTKASKDDGTIIDKAFGPIISRLISAASDGVTSKVDGKGETNQTGKMSAKVTAVVKQVLPNGTMVIEGAKSLTLNKEVQNFRITGIVRREDILPNNTVRSENIAEAIIAMNGKGMIADRQRRGILTRLLDWLF